MKNTACFIGDKLQQLPCGFDESHYTCLKIKECLIKTIIGLIENKNVTHFISSASLGVNMWTLEILHELKDDYPYITIEASLPCRSQEKVWKESYRRKYYRLLSLCDKIFFRQKSYSHDCILKNYLSIINQSDYVVTVWNKRNGLTENLVRYALQNNKTVYCINTTNFGIKTLYYKIR